MLDFRRAIGFFWTLPLEAQNTFGGNMTPCSPQATAMSHAFPRRATPLLFSYTHSFNAFICYMIKNAEV